MSAPRYLSISDLAQLLNQVLESSFPRVYFEGEISEITRAASGHIYLSIKDEKAQINAVMWKSKATSLEFRPAAGMRVQCQARPNVYPNTGRLQMILDRMIPSGEGLLQKRFEELKAKLEKEGLFDAGRKRPLPFFPICIGIVTSAQGAVIHDIMVKIRERMPSLRVWLADVRVQGEGAAQEIAEAVRRLCEIPEIEAVIVARGGGSLEDRWAFNEEAVVRAIFAARVPVISGVGHEVDVSLSDLAADVRAPTPTAAAEMVVPHRIELARRVGELERRLSDYERWLLPLAQRADDLDLRLQKRIGASLEAAGLRLAAGEAKLRSIRPEKVLALIGSKLEILEGRMSRAAERSLRAAQSSLTDRAGRLERLTPLSRIGVLNERLSGAAGRLDSALSSTLSSARHALASLSTRLDAASPQCLLERGYSIVESERGVISSAADLREGESVKLQFARGSARAEVTERLAESNERR